LRYFDLSHINKEVHYKFCIAHLEAVVIAA